MKYFCTESVVQKYFTSKNLPNYDMRIMCTYVHADKNIYCNNYYYMKINVYKFLKVHSITLYIVHIHT